MLAVIQCESQFNTEIQSQHHYTAKNVPKGYKVGDREQSYGLVQIHLPAHPTITKEQAIDPEFAVDFMAKNIKTNPNMWTCYKTIAMR
jgi:hypothetical protein